MARYPRRTTGYKLKTNDGVVDFDTIATEADTTTAVNNAPHLPIADGANAGFDPFAVGQTAINTSNGVNAVNGARMIRWVAPRTTRVSGFIARVVTTSGNIEAAIYDASFVKLGGTGPQACPPANAGRHLTFATSVPVEAGKSYWLSLAADNTVAQFGTITGTVYSGMPLMCTATGMYPSPTRINPVAQGIGVFGASPAFILIPTMEPLLVKRIASDVTVSGSQLVGYDATNKRIFGRTGSATLTYSNDYGATMQNGAVFTGELIQAAAVAGNYLFIATWNSGAGTGKVYRGPRNGPFTTNNFTATLTGQEGYCRPWELVGYDDGIVFAGNYTAPYASQVRLRRSTDFGATWQVVIDLGAGNTNAEHVHSVVRSTTNPSRVYCDIGDGLAQSGLYVSDDSGATWSRKSAFGPIRLTPGYSVPNSNDVLWGSDQYGYGGNLWYYDATADTLQPRALHAAPWYGDVYALCTDSKGRVWYFNRGEGLWSSRRACLFMTPDFGMTNYLMADIGMGQDISDTMFILDNYLFLGNRMRFNVSGV